MDFKEKNLPSNPIAKAHPISKLLLLWIFPLFRKGYNKELEAEDLYDIAKEDETEHLGNKLERYWQLELDRAKLTGKKPSLSRALIKMSWKSYFFVAAVYTVNQLVVVAQITFLPLFIQTFNDHNAESWQGYAYAGGISCAVLLNTLTLHPGIFKIMRLGMKLRVALSTLIYRKSLRLSKAAQNETSSGQIVNLLSNDCMRLDAYMNYLPFIISAPPQMTILMYFLYNQVGVSSFVGGGFIVILLPLQYYLFKYSGIFRGRIAKQTDERGRFMNEIIVGMRVIKQYAWEGPFSLLIAGVRKLEVDEIQKRGLLRGLHFAMLCIALKIMPYLTLLTVALLDDEPMTADRVFFTLTCLHTVMYMTVNFIPQAVTGIGEIRVAVKRIQNFLLLEDQTTNNMLRLPKPPKTSTLKECDDETTKKLLSTDNMCMNEMANHHNGTSTKQVAMQNVCARWTSDSDRKPTLDDITFSVEGDKLVMVVGPVGSSKTSLLNAIIDELPISSGSLTVSGSVSYAAQEPWIFAGNLRQNILFGLPYEEEHYKQTVKACALEEDLEQLPYGDMTVVGERGVALSGGQKARVNLARAIYRKCDIYLLDDPLSAVDTRVGRHLFEKCVKEHLSGSTRILVTHQLQYLSHADTIIVLDEGKILAQGTFQELNNAGVDFVQMLESESQDEAAASVPDATKNPHKAVSPVEAPVQEKNSATKENGSKPKENVEQKSGGSVPGATYWEYFLSGHSVFGFSVLFMTFLLCQLFASGNDYWLSYWTNAEQKRHDLKNNITICSEDNANDAACEDTYLGENVYLYTYTGFAVAITIMNVCRGLFFYVYVAKTSSSIHNKMFQSLVRAPIQFFDENPSGRIMNRFTKDVGTMDEMLPPTLIDTTAIFFHVLGIISLVILSNHYMIVPTVFLFLALYSIRKIFVETARDIKKIESISKSPVYTHVVASMTGLTTIRACKSQNVLIKQFEGHQDIHSSSWFMFIGATRWFAIWLEMISNVFLMIVTFSFLLLSTSDKGGDVGLAISGLITMMGTFQWGMRQSAEAENYMTSVERALEYSKLAPEADLDSKPSEKPACTWPGLGQITFNKVYLSYQEGKPVLKNLNFEIRPSEKIGIVGRTGAGKSSIIAALFRLTEPEGEILIDNVAVKQIGLHDLRKNISIIPQDPVLFSGSVRYNLDPFNQFEDHHLWKVIEQVELRDAVSSLDYHVADGGTNFSVGQRQLVCLARAILRKNRILVMDEATANVDPRTDQLIQQTIRSKFSDCTIITIAHRLHTIIDCNRILVLDNGQLKEYDHPHVLLQNNEGIFTGMVVQTGQTTEAMLRKLAREAKETKPSFSG